jgi:hypothetical protein
MEPLGGDWANTNDIGYRSYTCGYCGERTGVKVGYYGATNAFIYICGGCNRPTFFHIDSQTPSPTAGNDVERLPVEIDILYSQARRSTQVEAYTACVLVCRKILMHVAVQQGADENLKFIQYVEYLADNGYVPPHGKGWVDHIRKKGNEANHEIGLMKKDEAFELLSFVELLLKFVYELPARIMPDEDEA